MRWLAAQRKAITNTVREEMVNWYEVLRGMPLLPHNELNQELQDELRREQRRMEEEAQDLYDEWHREQIRAEMIDASV